MQPFHSQQQKFCRRSEHRLNIRVVFAACLLAIVWQPGLANAQTTFNWTGGFNDNIWSFGDNWDNNSDPFGPVPGSADTARFNLNSTYAVRFDAFAPNWNLGTLDIDNGNITLEVFGSGPRSLTTNDGFSINGSSSVLTLGPGLTWNNLGSSDISGGGTVNISSADSLWINSGVLDVGRTGSGTLNIQNGGMVTSSGNSGIGENQGSTGTVTISGTGSRWDSTGLFFRVGNSGNGTLSIQDGGVLASVNGKVARLDSSVGFATVDGSSSQWINSGDFRVGERGNGTLVVQNGGVVSVDKDSIIGEAGSSIGSVTVDGADSQWNSLDFLIVGNRGRGTLNIQNGGVVSNTDGTLGFFSESTNNVVTVTGAGSQWMNSGNLTVGKDGSGTLKIQDNGRVEVGDDTSGFTEFGIVVSDSGTNGQLLVQNGSAIQNDGEGILGFSAGSTGSATVDGTGSLWQNSGVLKVGRDGSGTLNIRNGGRVTSSGLIADIASDSGSTGTVTISGTGSRWDSTGFFHSVGTSGNGTLNIEDSGVLASVNGKIGFLGSGVGIATVDGSGSQWTMSGDFRVGESGNGTLTVRNGGVVSIDKDSIIGKDQDSVGSVTVDGAGSQWNSSTSLEVGDRGTGTLNIQDNGRVGVGDDTSGFTGFGIVVSDSGTNGQLLVQNGSAIHNDGRGILGMNAGSTGTATVSGSLWQNTGGLIVGRAGIGTLNIQDGGSVNSNGFDVGQDSGSTGTVTISGAGSRLDSTGFYRVGHSGNGTLNIEDGGVLASGDGKIGSNGSGVGIATVNGSGSQWTISGDFRVGDNGDGTLIVQNSGVVSVDTSSIIGNNTDSVGSVTVDGAGSQWNSTTSLEVGDRGTGTLNIQNGGIASNSDATIGNRDTSTGNVVTVTGTGSQWNNSGNLKVGADGNGTLSITNNGLVSADGEVSINSDSSINLSNSATLTGTGGIMNDGSINFTSGLNDVHGVINNSDTGIIDIGQALATFHNDVIMEPSNMNIQNEGLATFMGSYNGGSDGLGAVLAFGELRPGNSSAWVDFDGNLELANTTETFIELGGTGINEFDQLAVAGDLFLDGSLTVELINGFTLADNQQFLIFDANANLFGTFAGLSEGDRVAQFGDFALEITYSGFNGNAGVGLTAVAVPEPGSMVLLGVAAGLFMLKRRRSRPVANDKVAA